MPATPKQIDSNAFSTAKNADIMNNIRSMASADYQRAVPEVTYDRESYVKVGSFIWNNPAYRNEFFSNLAQNFAFIFGSSKMYYNKYRRFKKGIIELGEIIEEIYVEIAKPSRYNPAIADTVEFKRTISNVQTALYMINYKTMYSATIEKQTMASAFTSERGLFDLIGMIITSMSAAAEIDEQNCTKYLLARLLLDGKIKTVTIPALEDANKYDIASTMLEYSDNMEFPNSDMNYAGVINWSPKEYQSFWLTTKFNAYYDIRVLSAAFQLKYPDFMGQVTKIDSLSNVDFDRLNQTLVEAAEEPVTPFTEEEKATLDSLCAIIMDDGLLQIYSRLVEWGETPVRSGLYWNNFLHIWNVYASSPFAPAIAFTTAAGSVTSVKVSPATATLPVGAAMKLTATVVTTGFARKDVTWTSSNENVTVDANGVVNIKSGATGTATITATSVEDTTKSGIATITVATA